MTVEHRDPARRQTLGCSLALAFVATLAVATAAPAAPPEVADPGWVLDGPVSDLAASPDGIVYAAGDFMLAAPRTGPFAILGPGSGAAAPSSELVGAVRAVVSDGAGGWFVGGRLRSAERPEIENLVHVRANGQLDVGWQPNPDGAVTALAVDGQTVYVGGDFGQIANPRVARSRLAAIDRETGRARSGWSASPNGSVSALLLDAGRLYVAGSFTALGTTLRNRTADVAIENGAVGPWDPNANGPVVALCRVGSAVVLGGSFTTIKDVARRNLAAVSGDGTPTAWRPTVDGPVHSLVLGPTGTVVIGGTFSQVEGQARRMIGAVDAQSGQLVAWHPLLDGSDAGSVESLVVSGGQVVAGGDFVASGSSTRRRLAGFDVRTGAIGAWPPSATGLVAAVAVDAAGTLAAGGSFGGVGSVERHRLAAFNAATGAPTGWNPDADGAMRALAISGPTVFVGGDMRRAGGEPRIGVAATDAATGRATGLRADTEGGVDVLAVAAGRLYIGGPFSTIAGSPRNGVAAVELAGGTLTSWDPAPNGSIQALLASQSGREILAGGTFTVVGTARPQAERPALVAFDSGSGATQPWKPSLFARGSRVSAIDELPGRILIGGDLALGGTRSTNLASIDLATGDARPLVEATGGTIQALTVFQGLVYLGGSFDAVAHDGRSSARPAIAAFEPGAELITGWNPGIQDGGSVQALAHVGPSLWLGGAFRTAGGRNQSSLVSFTQPASASKRPAVAGPPLVGATLSCRPGVWDLAGSTRIEWIVDDASVGSGTTYQPTLRDRDRKIACKEFATNLGGVAISASAPVTLVGAVPRIDGTALVGEFLSCTTDPLGAPSIWIRGLNGTAVGSGPTYRAGWSDAGRRLACQIQVTAEDGSAQPVNSLPTAKVLPAFGVADRRGILHPKVLRALGALVVIPGTVARRSDERPRLISVRVQSTRRAIVRIRIGAGRQGVRFVRPGRANVKVRAGAAFLPPLRRLPVEVTVVSGGTTITRRATIGLSG